ncbi:hypothetical protein CEE34_06830 [Candidatus Aerophobetes bacterium Ae_b3a]|nr:MAG: hypothetical protein CEE34_06830 [Candidatus Aerophobetes bacterium Ae_b3a]
MKRIFYFKGSPREVGLSNGKALGKKLDWIIGRIIEGIEDICGINIQKLEKEALPWLHSLPVHFQEELEGIAEGADIPLRRVAEWFFAFQCANNGCTGLIRLIDGDVWVARNNDYILPELWGYTIIRDVDGRIPTMIFGTEGEVFSATGVNKERLWLHYNWLPVWDKPSEKKQCLFPYVFLREALETCSSITDVADLLEDIERDGGMNLFVIDGKSNEFCIFECSCSSCKKRKPQYAHLSATNHYCASRIPDGFQNGSRSSLDRLQRTEELLKDKAFDKLPENLIQILKDSKIEQSSKEAGTIYSNVACPGKELVWYAYGEFPAASRGTWHQLNWPWP